MGTRGMSGLPGAGRRGGVVPTGRRTPRAPGLAVLGLVAALAWPLPARALPDLVPSIYDIVVATGDVPASDVEEGCAGGQFGRRLVRFSLKTTNAGDSDLYLGATGCPNCSLNPGATCANPLFECGTSHGHAHFEDFAINRILDDEGNVVAEGLKYGFCIFDHQCATPTYSCSFQGLTAGCSDVYAAGLSCQYVDITDLNLPDGIYTLRTVIDPEDTFAESDEANNVVEAQFTIGSTARTCPEFTSTDVPTALADLATSSSVVTVPDLGPVSELRVRLEGTHTYLSDLEARLVSPSSTSRTLFSAACGTSDDFDLYLGDGAIDGFACPAHDGDVLRQPFEDFTPFHGEPAAGDWTLEIQDTGPGDSGELVAWSLEVCSLCGNGELDPGEACDDGNGLGGDCCAADCLSALGDGSPCEDGNLCTQSEACASGACVPGGAVQCDPCLVCEPEDGCVVPDLAYPCQLPPSGRSSLRLTHDELDPARDTLLWKWLSATPVEVDELGAPELVSDVTFCLYGGDALLVSSTIPGASTCDGEPCWRRAQHAVSFKDGDAAFDGLTSIRLKETGAGTLRVRGRGTGLGIAALQPDYPVTARLRRSDGTPCWEAVFDSALDDTATSLKARSR